MPVIGNTELLATKQDLISDLVQVELRASTKILPYVMDVSAFAGKGAKSVSFPKLTSFVPEDRASATAGTDQVLTSSVDTLQLDKRKYISWIVDPNDEIQSTIEFQSEAAKRAAAAHGRAVEADILAEIELTASLNVLGATPADVSRDNLLAMREWLFENNANMNNTVFYMAPDQETALLKIADFVRADSYGSSNIGSGVIGRLYGMPVIVSNLVKSRQFLAFDKEGIAIGFQRRPAFDEEKDIRFGVGAMRNAVEQLYGVKAMQIGEQAGGKNTIPVGTSPLIAKLID